MQKKYYSQITRKIISLVLVFDLIIVSCFCYGITADNTKAADVGGVNADDTWYTSASEGQGDTVENPYIIDSTGKLLSLSLMLKNSGYGTMEAPLLMVPKVTTLPAIIPPDTTEPSVELPIVIPEPTPEPPIVPPEVTIPPSDDQEPTTEPSQPAGEQSQSEVESSQLKKEPTRGIMNLDRSFATFRIATNQGAESGTEVVPEPTPTPGTPPEPQPEPTPTPEPTPEPDPTPDVPKDPETPVVPGDTTESGVEENPAPNTSDEGIMTLEAPSLMAVNTDPVIQSGFKGKFFRLSVDINMEIFDNSTSTSGKFSLWTPIGTAIPFNGTFTGDTGIVISNFMYNNDTAEASGKKALNYWGFFGHLGSDAVVDNLTFKNVNFHVADSRMNEIGSSMGVVAGFNSGLIKNVNVEAPDVVIDGITKAGIELPNTKPMKSASQFGSIAGSNSGVIMNATFIGNIHSDGELLTGIYDGMGIGGIAGATLNSGKIVGCMVKSDITFKDAGMVTDINKSVNGIAFTIYVGGITGSYNGIGTAENPSISNCVFNGSIKGKAASRSYNGMGGIAGKLGSGYISECIVSADIWCGGSQVSEYTDGVGGIAGYGTGTIDSSFAMGTIEAAYYAGGIAGQGIAVKNSYYTGSIKTLEAGYKDISGGLLGKGDLVSQSYFAGATLTPHTGSIAGSTAQTYNATTGVFYDKLLSPNSATMDSQKAWTDGAGKTTDELCSESFTGFTSKTVSESSITAGTTTDAIWITSNSSYPQLAWTKNLTPGEAISVTGVTAGSMTVSENYVNLVQNISKISTAKWLDANSSNSHGNSYEMRSSFGGNLSPIDVTQITGTGITSTYENTTLGGVYNKTGGNYNENIVGDIHKNRVDFVIGDTTFSGITMRKTLYAPKSSDLTVIESGDEFYKFLDYWQGGGGAVLGSKYTINTGETIKLDIPVKPLNNYVNSAFCGQLDGGNTTVSALAFSDNSVGLLGVGVYASVLAIDFTNVTAGTKEAPIKMCTSTENKFGTLFSSISYGNISDIVVDGLAMNIIDGDINSEIGGVVGRFNLGGTVKNIKINNLKGQMGNYSSPTQLNKLERYNCFGGITGYNAGTISNVTVSGIDMGMDLYEVNYNGGTGGVVGNSIGGIDHAKVTGSIMFLVEQFGTSFAGAVMGGIVGKEKGIIESCDFSGTLKGYKVGGIVGNADVTSRIINSTSMGEIISVDSTTPNSEGGVLGGITGIANGATISNSMAFIDGSGQSLVGGLIGQNVNGTSNIDGSYANGIIISTDTNSFIGGLVGEVTKGTTNIKNSYFAGQVQGLAQKGGLVGNGKGTVNFTSSMFDKEIAGRLSSIGSNPLSDNLGVGSSEITTVALGGSAFTDGISGSGINISSNYPQLKKIAENTNKSNRLLSDISTRKVLSVSQSNEYLQGLKTGNINVVEKERESSYGITTTPSTIMVDGSITDVLMNRNVTDGAITYVPTGISGQGNLDVDYDLNLLTFGVKTLELTYKVGLKPFDYGEGTIINPYIIYSPEVFLDFARFVSAGRDTNFHYKIGSVDVVQNIVIGNPIELDLGKVEKDLIPVHGFTGTLNGNNSTLSGINTLPVKMVKDGNITNIYQGLFGSVNNTATIKDLTVKVVGATTQDASYNTELYMGGLVAYMDGGTLENIVVDMSRGNLNITGTGGNAYVGSLVGWISDATLKTASIKNITAFANITGNATKTIYAGGAIGYVNDAGVTIDQVATYGKIKEVKNQGGIIGGIKNTNRSNENSVNIKDSASLTDMSVNNMDGIIGGLVGYNNSKGSYDGVANPTPYMGLNLKITNCYQGGKITGNTVNTSLGGIIGKTDMAIDTGKRQMENILTGTFTANDILEGKLSADEQIKKSIDTNITGTYYRYDENPYPAMNMDVYGYYTYHATNSRNGYLPYSDTLKTIENGKSSTWKLTSTLGPDASWNTGGDVKWSFEKGLFPILKNPNITTSEALKVSDNITFDSIALFMTRAGKIGEDKYQNTYVTYNPTSNKPVLEMTENGSLKKTTNGAMVVATGQNTTETVTLNWKNFVRSKTYTASTEASGNPDFSWYVVNPQGMWSMPPKTTTETETDSGGNITTKTAIDTSSGWVLHTSDQLAGLALLTDATGENEITKAKMKALEVTAIPEETMDLALINSDMEVEDGNGVTIAKTDFYIPKDSSTTEGDTTTSKLWRVMLGKDVDLSTYKNFKAIGSTNMPFSYKFDGYGKVISGLQFTASAPGITSEAIGLFGTVSSGAIENLGLMKGKLSLNNATEPVGSLVGKITNGTLVQNCFSAMGMFGDNVKAYVGGMVGESDGTHGRNTIKNTFFTGGIQVTGELSIAGGLAGTAKDTNFTNSYTAGYVDGTTYGAIVGNSESGNNGNSNIYDKEATGEMAGAGIGNLDVSAKSTMAMLTSAAMEGKSGWKFKEGYYPIQETFTTGEGEALNVADNAKVAVIPIQFKPSARSTSEGKVLSTDSALKITTNAIDWNVTKGQAVITKDALGYTNFSMKESGMIWASLGINGQSRDTLFNLRCWYDDYKIVDGKKVYTIAAASELAELSAIVNGTVNTNNPNGTHRHKDGGDVFDDGYSHQFDGETILLDRNIDLSTIENWTSIGNQDKPFKGTFDGQENVLFNLHQNLTTKNFGGLFGEIWGATVKNVGMQGGTIISTEDAATGSIVGGLVAKATDSIVENSFTSMTMNVPKTQHTGGIIGLGLGTTSVKDCFTMSDITGGVYTGGIAGKINGEISRSYNTGILRADTGITGSIGAGIVAELDTGGTVDNCFVGGYIFGGMAYGIAPDKVSNCQYDKQMTGAVTPVANATASTTLGMSKDGLYTGAAGHSTGNSDIFKGARGLSILVVDFADKTFETFQSGKTNRKLADNTEINMKLSGGIFRCVPVDESYVVSVENASIGGSDNLVASVDITKNGEKYSISKPYYLFTKPTLAIRYNFIFTDELIAELSGGGITGGGESIDGVENIATMGQLQDLSSRINKGEPTSGKTYKLTTDIDGGSLVPIGTKENPFNGTLDGNGHSIKNVTVDGNGNVGFFAYIGNTGKVKNLKLEKLTVMAGRPSTGNLYVGAIAAHNNGAIVNVSVIGTISVLNAGFDGTTYLGGLVGENAGRVEGCYFVAENNGIAISHSSKVTDFAAGLAGVNKGSFVGCYVSSDMKNINIKGIFGSTKDGTFKECYYNCGDGNNATEPLALAYAYDNITKDSVEGKKVFVPYNDMKNPAFSQMLSSNLYGGTYYQGGNVYPELYCFQLMNLDLGQLELMLSMRNLVAEGSGKDSFMNALCGYKNFDFPYFSNIAFDKELQVDMPVLDRNIYYSVGARIYGNEAMYTDIGKDNTGLEKVNVLEIPNLRNDDGKLSYYKLSKDDITAVNTPKTIMVNVTLKPGDAAYPWGVFKKDSIGK